MSTVRHGEARLPSPDFINSSDDELFSATYKPHETVATLPLKRPDQSDASESEHETLATLPLDHVRTQTQSNTGRLTQPTQILRRSPPANMSSPSRTNVQVAASSPISTPAPARKPSGYLANAMAPAGTMFRKPFVPPQPRPQPIIIDDDDGPTFQGGSSDDDREDLKKNDIKPTIFQRAKPESDAIPESPAKGNNLFKSITANSYYSGLNNGVKRSADSMANSYGSVYKKQRQTGPSRAMPSSSRKSSEPDMDFDDIGDPNMRTKVKRMTSVLTAASISDCYNALLKTKGNYDDATDMVLLMSEKKEKQAGASIDLTASDDELAPTPAGARKQNQPPVRQQAKAPAQSIKDKYGGARKLAPAPTRRLEVFDEPPKKKKTLVRGRKDRSSPVPEAPRAKSAIGAGRPINVDSDSDEADSGIQSAPDNSTFQLHLVDFFNKCTPADLADTASIKLELAEHIVSKRPFKTRAAIEKVENPDLKPSKGKRVPLGAKVAEKVDEMLDSYDAVDYLVKQCENLAKPLEAEMKTWGIDTTGKEELDMASLSDSQRSGHDSGIGTPISDDEKKAVKKKFLGQPSIMNHDYKMKDYQIVGMNWLNMLYKRKLSCILADDMGLGKTYQVIAFLSHLFENGEQGPHLIVVPAATLENWLQEFQRFCPALNVEPYYASNPDERAVLREEIDANRDDINVLVTTYHVAKAKEDWPWLKEFRFCCTVFDEGHVLKNADSQVSSRLSKIKSSFRLLLTGTPLQNNLRELVSLLGFLMPILFREKREELASIFAHNVKAMDENHEALLSAQRIGRARSMLTPFILRRKKAQVLKDLPTKHRRVEWCDLTVEQAEIYNFWRDKALDIRDRREKGELLKDGDSAQVLMKLRQASIHPLLFRRLYTDDMLPKIANQCLKGDMWRESNPDLIVTELRAYSDMEIHNLCSNSSVISRFALQNDEWLASGKVQRMLSLLRTWMAEGSRTLIFSQFTMVLDILELVLEKELISYFRLDGSTKVSERQDLIDEFSGLDNHTPVFMLSTKAGGAGINLAKANKVIVFDSGFNPQDDIQAENRAHRIGQEKEVEVVRLVGSGTVEETIYNVGEVKVRLDEQVAGGGVSDGNGTGVNVSGTATPMEQEVGAAAAKGKNGKKGAVEVESEVEKKGRKEVEDLFFQKLKEGGGRVKAKADEEKEKEVEAGEEAQVAKEEAGAVELEEVKAEQNNNEVKIEDETKKDKTKVPSRPKKGDAASKKAKSRSRK